MEITLTEAFAGQSTKIKGKQYLSTQAYVEPFIDKMSKYTNNFIVNGIQPEQITITKDGDIDLENITWNRLWIQAIMPDSSMFDNHDRVVGMVYGLDVRKPIVKFYVGGLNRACCNLCVFSPSFLDVKEIEPETAIDYKPIERLMSQVDNVKVMLEKLTNTEVSYNDVNENLGLWVRNTLNESFTNNLSRVKLATSSAIDAYKLLYEKEDSPYYVPENTTTNMFNIYNAWTQVICEDRRDIINKCEKVLLVKDILGF